MSKFTKKVKEDAKIWAPDYETDFRKRSLRDYLNSNNITRRAYIREVVEEIRQNKKDIYAIYYKDANREAQRRFREKNKKQRYFGSVDVNFYFTKFDTKQQPYTFIKQELIDFDKITTKKNVGNDARDMVENKRIDYLRESSINNVEVKGFKMDVNPFKEKGSLEETRMKDTNAVKIDGYGKQKWDTNTGRCVFDYIIYKYGNVKGFKSACNYEDLHDIFSDYDDSINLFEKGVNTKEIRRFCENFRLPMYALDDTEKVFQFYQPENVNHHGTSMVFRVSNKHFYPIENSTEKKRIAHQSQIRSDIIQQEFKAEAPACETDYDLKKVQFENDVMGCLKNHIKQGVIPKKLELHNNELVSFWIDNIQYVSNINIELNKQLCENMKQEYKGQGSGTLLFKILEETIGTFPKSSPNKFVMDKLIEAKKDRAHIGFIGDNKDTTDCVGIDISKAYTYCMYNMEKWLLFDFNDMWVEYDGSLKFGLYYVQTDDLLLFRGNNIYTDAVIRKAQQEGIQFDILYQLIPSKTIDNVLKSLIDKIVEYSCDNTCISKQLINMFSGMLGKNDVKSCQCYINNDLNQIFNFINNYKDKGYKLFSHKIEDTDFYMYGYEVKKQLNETNIPMYIQILDYNNIRMYDMMKEVGGELVARKVDCCIVRNPNPIVEGKEWGSYRYCEVPVICGREQPINLELSINKDWRDHYINDSDDWMKIKKVLDREKGLLLQGDAGKGKTYCAKQIIKNMNRVKVLAPTNKAALNIGGSTIHSFLKMNDKGYINPKLLKLIKQNYDCIVIDEISMIGKELWKRLSLLKRECPDVKFLLLGDDKQIPPVEDEDYDDYFNHPAVKFLCNNQRNTLTVLKRYDEDLYKLLCDVDDLDINDFKKEENPINICYYNSTRKMVNAKWNEKKGLFVPENIYDEYSQDMYVYEGLPIVCHKTRRIDSEVIYANSETFTVSGYDEEVIHIWNERPSENGESEIYMLDVPIKEFNEYFLLGYCTTTHKIQGATITKNFTIYDWGDMTTKLRYTALSRAKRVEQVSFGKGIKPEPNMTFKKNIEKKLEGHRSYDRGKGYENNIKTDDIMKLHKKQEGLCAKCYCQMKTQKYYTNDTQQFSIDRINSNMGHTRDNTQLLCWGCNRAKMNRD